MEACSDRLIPGFDLVLLPEDQVTSIISFLDLATFALAVAPSSSVLFELIQSDSFEGWFCEIKRLHRLCPWTSKQPMDKIIASSLDLQARRYRSMLQSLDQQFLKSGMKVTPES